MLRSRQHALRDLAKLGLNMRNASSASDFAMLVAGDTRRTLLLYIPTLPIASPRSRAALRHLVGQRRHSP